MQWRLPLAIQIPWGVVMFAGLATFMPNSPRQLIRQGKVSQARREFEKIRRDLEPTEMQREFALMESQIEYEMTREIKSFREIYKLYQHRVLVSVAVQTCKSPTCARSRQVQRGKFVLIQYVTVTSLTGVNVIQYYQTILYKSLGIERKTILALTAVYGTVAFVSNAITTKWLLDQWGRRKMMLAGMAGIVLIEIYAAVMQRFFQESDSRVGKGFAILGIYLFVAWYYSMMNSTTWLYGAEVLPVGIRSSVMGIAAASHFIVNVGITEAGPSAFANIGENYYYVFVGCTFFFLVMGYFYFPETRRKSLEEIARDFGDKVIEVDETQLGKEQVMMGRKDVEDSAEVDQVERQ